MSSMARRMSQSFQRLKEVLGFSSEQKTRVIPMNKSELKLLRQEEYKDNIVTTSKYNFITFLPINLFQQLSKAANIYFCLITVLQTIKVVSISGGEPTMLPPLVLVVLVSMCKDAYEDYCRHCEDAYENKSICTRFNKDTNTFEKVFWGEVQVGDFIRVKQDEFFPADMLVVRSTEDEGVCYVETKNLDGETNLKNKVVPKDLWSTFQHPEQSIRGFDGRMSVDGPNNLIYKFEGCLEMLRESQLIGSGGPEKVQVPLNNDNIALRGMSLRNVEEVLGLIIYTGHETKIQMNTTKAAYKISKMMHATNLAIFWIFIIQVLFSVGGAAYCAWWMSWNLDSPYLNFDMGTENYAKNDMVYNILTMTGSWILIFCNFVPISLLVTLEMVKFFQGSFMEYDLNMLDEEQNFFCKAQSTNINEELGQVEYIFSDKTGTLTCNIMEFKKFSTKAAAFDITPVPEDAPAQQTSVQAIDFTENPNGLEFRDERQLKEILNDYYHKEKESLNEVLLHLAVCHTVVVDKNKGVYNAASPDELSLVDGAKSLGFQFMGRETDNVLLVMDNFGYKLRYKVLNVLEFNSTRKRMSVIVRNQQTGYIELYSKGADSIMEKLLRKGDREHDEFIQRTKDYIDSFSKEGLRTLMLTKKDVSEREYSSWLERYEKAERTMINREETIMAAAAEIETDMTLVGSTAIEDRLQDQVQDTIVSMKDAGIKIWVLTGDKVETAIQIGFSTGLLNNEMQQHIVDSVNFAGCAHQLAKVADSINQAELDDVFQPSALILSGESLNLIYQNKGLLELLLQTTDDMDVVIGCRVSPKQKGDVVALMRLRHPKKIMLAIGDGANDCNMISKAHVGVGIAGKEGMQAARTSDFAIGKFKFLKDLMFVHGREAYRRNGELILFMFYKNVLYVMVQYMFGVFSVFSGQTLYEKWIYQIYNVSFTGLHNIWYALFDFEFEREEYMSNPQYYSIGMQNVIFNLQEFWIWFCYANLQALMILSWVFWSSEDTVTEQGKTFNFWAGGHHVYMNCVLLANLIILKMQHNITGFNLVLIGGQIVSFFALLFYFQSELQTDVIYQFMEEFLSSKTAWLGGFLSVSSLFTIDVMFHSMRVSLRSCLFSQGAAVEQEGQKGNEDAEEQTDDIGPLPRQSKRRQSRRYSTRERSLAELQKQIASIQ